jgi:hypothetical protein
VGIWYQAYSGASRDVTVSVRYRGRVKARRRLRATSRWRNSLLACPGYPNAGRWYTSVKGSGWPTTFVTRVVIDRE